MLKPFHLNRIFFLTILLNFFFLGSVYADENQVLFSYCYGSPERLFVEGRVLEIEGETKVSASDNWLVNAWRKLGQLRNEESKDTNVNLRIKGYQFHTKTDDEGFFIFEAITPGDIKPGFHQLYAQARNAKESSCQLLIIPANNKLGIISDFDDTVIVTDVLDKDKAIGNTLTLNYKQRTAVNGIANWYREILKRNENPKYAALFFVTGSPKQLQKGIQQFLDYHQFPYRTVIAKKISGDNSDPLFDQFQYKLHKIEQLLQTFPDMSFVFVGDDGEKDPEVYHAIYEKMPSRVHSIWIRAVNPSSTRPHYPEQRSFKEAPKTH